MSPNNVSDDVPEVSPNEGLKIPEWINEEYFHPIIENDYPDFQRVVKFTPIAATGPGENFTSIMVRVHIVIELKDSSTARMSYILKTMLEEAESGGVLDNMQIFPKEREIYHSILPQFEKLYAEAGRTVHFGPQCKHVEDVAGRITIVMEDLKPRQFQNIDRRFGFDLPHIEGVLKKLAEFHAASAVYYERFGPFSEHFSQSFFNEENRPFLENMSSKKEELFLYVMSQWGGCEKYIKLWPKSSDFLTWFIKNQNGSPDEFRVLNHADLWSNNIMFNYTESGDVNQTLFVDFQLCSYGSPTQDLNYVITASAGYDIRITEFDRFLRIYQEHLAENLKMLKYSKKIPTLKEIHNLMIKYSLWSFFAATNVLPVVLIDSDDDSNVDNMFGNEEFLIKSLMNPRFVKTMRQLLTWWENRGLFQIDI